MEEIRDVLHLDVMTVTGKTLGENLDELKANGFYERCQKWLDEANKKYGINLTKEDIIKPYDNAIGTVGSIAVLKGNLAPEGAVIKHTACPKEMYKAVLYARPFVVKRSASMQSFITKSIKVTQFSFDTKDRRAAVCLRCSILPKQSVLTKSSAAASP